MIKTYPYKQFISWLCLLLFICTGCIYEKLEECEDEETCIRFNFIYDYNMLQTDLFAEQVDHITLLIYTENGQLEQTYEVYRPDMETNHTISLMLPPGLHTAVAWGNCHTDHYQIQNQETTAGLQLEMTCIDKTTMTMTRVNPGTLFHASNTFQVIEGNEYTVPMEMIKNTNQVKVVIKGLTEEDRLEATERFKLRLLSNNWKYNYDNSISSKQAITYITESYQDEEINENPGEIAISYAFYPLRLFTYDRETILSLQYRNPHTGREAAIEKHLIPYLLNQPGRNTGDMPANDTDNEYLDREDSYEVTFILGTNIDGSITIEEWNPIDQGGEL